MGFGGDGREAAGYSTGPWRGWCGRRFGAGERSQLPKAVEIRMTHLWRSTKGLSSGGTVGATGNGAATVVELRRSCGTRGWALPKRSALRRGEPERVWTSGLQRKFGPQQPYIVT